MTTISSLAADLSITEATVTAWAEQADSISHDVWGDEPGTLTPEGAAEVTEQAAAVGIDTRRVAIRALEAEGHSVYQLATIYRDMPAEAGDNAVQSAWYDWNRAADELAEQIRISGISVHALDARTRDALSEPLR